MQAALFYADNRMVASTNPVWFQTVFDTLTGLFDWLGLNKNVLKTVCMVFHPCQAVGIRADEGYARRMTGVERNYKERQRERFICPNCGKYLARGSLDTHYQI